MKAKFTKILALPSLAALSSLMISTALAQELPVGTWDLAVSGNQKGLAFITFAKDNTLTGFQILKKGRFKGLPDATDRGGALGGRGDSPSSFGVSNFWEFGFFYVAGRWNLDDKGRLVGFFSQGVPTDDPNVVDGRSLSFEGRFKADKRIVLKVNDTDRNIIYRGIPFAEVPTQDGTSWFARAKYLTPASSGSSTNASSTNSTSLSYLTQFVYEFFSLTNVESVVTNDAFLSYFSNVTNSPAVVNTFIVSGNGPGYTNVGIAMFSATKRTGIVTRQFATTSETGGFESSLRSLTGTTKYDTGKTTLTGEDDLLSKISPYKATRY